MLEIKQNMDISELNKSQGTHNFHPLNPDSSDHNAGKARIIESGDIIYKKDKAEERYPKMSLNQSILGGAFMMTNICLGTTILNLRHGGKASD